MWAGGYFSGESTKKLTEFKEWNSGKQIKMGWTSISLKMPSVDRRQMAGHNDHLTHININSSYQIIDFIDWIVDENNPKRIFSRFIDLLGTY